MPMLDARTLYLDARVPLRVLRDGPALVVRQPAAANRLYPVRRLFRVVSTGPVNWAIDALLVCAESGVTVDFLHRDGRLRATLSSPDKASRLLDLDGLLEALLEHPEGLADYRLWFAAQAQHRCLERGYAGGSGNWSACASTARRLLQQRARHHARSADLRRLDRQIHGLVHAYVTTLLAGMGVTRDNPLRLALRVEPGRDFAQVLTWELEDRKLTFLRRRQRTAGRAGGQYAQLDYRAAVGFFESSVGDIKRSFDLLLREFHRFLIERTGARDA